MDKLRDQRRDLPERAALSECEARAAALDAEHGELQQSREALGRQEHQLGAEVAEVAAKARKVEDTLYSGTINATKELEAHQEEIRLLREKQGELEEAEMELLEQIEAGEAAAAENRAARGSCDEEASRLGKEIARQEGEIDAEIARLTEQREALATGIPGEILTTYERIRAKERMHGRAAARLGEGNCEGCRVKLPVLEYKKMKAQPDDALIVCTSCGRVLVR
jgi:predicted  nucleic acid-binding Zn-ribbon protein